MTGIVFAPRALDDLDRLADFPARSVATVAKSTAPIIIGGLELLRTHPLMGRPAEHRLREALISRGRTGYVVLYEYDAAGDSVLILAVRPQRGAGFD